MFRRVIFAFIFVGFGCFASEARPLLSLHPRECNVTMPCDFSNSRAFRERAPRGSLRAFRSAQLMVGDAGNNAMVTSISGGRVVGGRPAGCPSSFCGCGAALRVFGR